MLSAARAPQRQVGQRDMKKAEERVASCRQRKALKAEEVHAWLEEILERRNEDGTLYLRKAQFQAVHKIACRVVHELNTLVEPGLSVEDPLLWCFHGLPGTGKSHVLKVVSTELFQNLLGWEMGVIRSISNSWWHIFRGFYTNGSSLSCCCLCFGYWLCCL